MENRIRALTDVGQSLWYDFILRSFITSGDLQKLVNEGLRGMTSNPTIFDNAISKTNDYDEDIRSLVSEKKSVTDMYEALAMKDISLACDVMNSIYNATNYHDGFVSLEVSPLLAHKTEETVTEAKRLYQALGKRNLMIKVPATAAGLPAVTELIGCGINVNVTLIFGIENYIAVAEAYIKGLEHLAVNGPTVANGNSIQKIGSVASFFVSRIDTAVDARLEKIGQPALCGKTAIANAKVAYAEYDKIFRGSRWEKLKKRGAKSQRLLWASTGTKNPKYSDTLYIDELIGPNTVNTAPPATIASFRDHGKVHLTLTRDLDKALQHIDALKQNGINLDEVTQQLQNDGVVLFSKSFEQLMKSIDDKMKALYACT